MIGHAVPLVRGGQHVHCGAALRQKVSHHIGQQILPFHGVGFKGVIQERRETLPQLRHQLRLEAPHVHAHQRVLRQICPGRSVVLGEVDAAGELFNAGALVDGDQLAVRIRLAHAPGNAAVVGDGVFQQIAHHAVLTRLVGLGQVGIELLEALHPVVVVGIDDCKGGVDYVPRRQNRLTGAPWLHPIRRHGIPLRQVGQGLIGIAHVHIGFYAAADLCLKIFLNLMLDNEHNGFKPRPAGVKHRVVQNDFSIGANRVHLLQSAVAAAHPCCHNHQNWFLHVYISLFPVFIPQTRWGSVSASSSCPGTCLPRCALPSSPAPVPPCRRWQSIRAGRLPAAPHKHGAR